VSKGKVYGEYLLGLPIDMNVVVHIWDVQEGIISECDNPFQGVFNEFNESGASQ